MMKMRYIFEVVDMIFLNFQELLIFIEFCDCLFLGFVLKEGNVLKVMEYIVIMVDFEECVVEVLEYLVEFFK